MTPSPPTILVVDDDADIRELLEEVLREAGYPVESARNGQEALERLQTLRPSLILLDLMMPVMSGAEFLEAFARTEMASVTPVIVLTAGSDSGPAPWEQHVRQVIRKPVDIAFLLDAIEGASARA